MKTNKELIAEYLVQHYPEEEKSGISTQQLAEILNIQRPNVSSILNQLVTENRVGKMNGRPVLYYAKQDKPRNTAGCFENLVGYDGSLKKAVQQAQAAILYPQKSLNTLIYGPSGVGKKFHAMLMHRFAIENNVLAADAPHIIFDCKEYGDNGDAMLLALLGKGATKGYYEAARRGVLVIDHAHTIPIGIRNTVLAHIDRQAESMDTVNEPIIIILCESNKSAIDEYARKLPIVIEMPPLNQRPLIERKELIQNFLTLEAARAKRTIATNAELMRCLLLYECELNVSQLKMDIKIGCANAYVREHRQRHDKLSLYIGDFENYVRKGFLNYKNRREEIERIIPGDYSYLFSETIMEMTALNRNKIKDYAFYEHIDRRAQEFAERGMTEADISLMLVTEMESLFHGYQNELVKQVVNTEQLSRLVDGRIIKLVSAFLDEASVVLNEVYPQSVLYGLCLHIDTVIKNGGARQPLGAEQIREIVESYKTEYALCLQLAAKIEKEFNVVLPIDEVVLITMFICFKVKVADTSNKPVMLYAMHGEGLATALSNTINSAVKMDNTYAVEIPFEQEAEEFYDELKGYVEQIDRGSGVIVFYDMDFLADVFVTIGYETGIEIRAISLPITRIGFDFARSAATECDIDEVYQGVMKYLDHYRTQLRRVIVTLCQTGEGGAQKLRNYIEQYGNLDEIRIIPLAMTDTDQLKEELALIMRHATIHCIVGTYDPQLFGIPFVPVSEVLGTLPQRLPEVLRLKKQTKEKEKEKVDFEAVYSYLDEQLDRVNIGKLKKILPDTMARINSEIEHLAFDTEMGLFLHIACSLNRLMANEKVPVHLQKDEIIEKHSGSYKKLLKILKPLESTFKVIFNDDEMAYILTIIYKI